VTGEERNVREEDDLLQPSEGVEASEEDVERPDDDRDDETGIAPEEHIGLTPPD
jgi:hypothetical protein